jgi:hypothetical protein
MLSAPCLFGQTTANPFIAYANHQSDLMHDAYVKRDVKTDKELLDDFMLKYNQLSPDDKANLRGYISNAYYNQSCIYSILNNKPMALAYLDSSMVRGFYDYKHLQEDSDMDNISHEARFKQLSDAMRSVSDYQYILDKGEKYNLNDQREIPAFTYPPASDPNLVALKAHFNLDSIAGSGNDISKILSILHWVHNTVGHDGQHESGILQINALSIINTAAAKKIGVSCGELATTLNDCYLALGFKARKVYCFPKDSLKMDYDSHVINVVYVPSLKKWIWVDPTNNAYVMDENGTLLSIEEVRERIINNKPLIVNPDANWNHKEAISKDYYLGYYMAKNLYRMYSPLSGDYDYQTPGKNKTTVYVMLLPLDYFKQGPDKFDNVNKETNSTVTWYRTNNPSVFWQLPKE